MNAWNGVVIYRFDPSAINKRIMKHNNFAKIAALFVRKIV